jgi:hypothetical protein
MEPFAAHLEDLHVRLTKLERENRWLKRGGCVVLVGVVSAMLMGQARPSRTVEAEKFALKDADGRTRAEMSFWESEPLLAFYDTEGRRTLGLSGTVLSLTQSNVKGKAGIYLEAGRPSIGPSGEERGGPSLKFYDADGKNTAGLSSTHVYFGARSGEGFPNRAALSINGLVFANPDGKFVAVLGGQKDISDQTTVPVLSLFGSEGEGPNIHLLDQEGFSASIGSTDTIIPNTGKESRTSAASIHLFGKDKKILWQAP